MTPDLRRVGLREVPAARGFAWIRHGFGAFFARPLAYSALLALLLIFMLSTRLLPTIGPIVFDSALPLVSLGFMLATQETLQGRMPSPRVFIRPLQINHSRRIEHLKLGVLYAAGIFLAILLSHWFDAGRMAQLQNDMLSDQFAMDSLPERLNDPQLILGMLWRIGLTSLVSLMFWHTPALVHWGRQTALKSLFFNVVALWRSKGAFLVYALTGAGIMLMFMLLGGILLGAMGQSQQLSGVVFMPGLLMFITVFYASLFFTFADSFELTAMRDDLDALTTD